MLRGRDRHSVAQLKVQDLTSLVTFDRTTTRKNDQLQRGSAAEVLGLPQR